MRPCPPPPPPKTSADHATVDPRALLAAACKTVGQRAWADAHDISGAYVSDILKGRREPGDKMCAALGIERIVT